MLELYEIDEIQLGARVRGTQSRLSVPSQTTFGILYFKSYINNSLRMLCLSTKRIIRVYVENKSRNTHIPLILEYATQIQLYIQINSAHILTKK